MPVHRTISARMNYPSFAGILVCTVLIIVPFVGLVALVLDVVMILRYVFGYRAPGSATWSIHRPSVTSLIVVWVVALCTIVVYPLAIYMTWRFIVNWRGSSKVCPRCAERIKSAALVCRHCGQELEVAATGPVDVPTLEPPPGSTTAAPDTSQRGGPVGVALVVVLVLAVVAFMGVTALIFLGGQVSTVYTPAGIGQPAVAAKPAVTAAPPCVIVMDAPQGHIELYVPGATVAQCQSGLADSRKGFGPDTATNTLYLSTIRPLGTPDCILGAAQVFVSGPTAADLKSRACSLTGS